MIANRRLERLGHLPRGGAAALLIMVLIVGVPWGLVSAVGWPLPHRIPNLSGIRTALTTRGIPDRTLINVLACTAWLAWMSVLLSLAEEIGPPLGVEIPSTFHSSALFSLWLAA